MNSNNTKTHKQCPRCKKIKTYSCFTKDISKCNSLSTYCKSCVKNYRKTKKSRRVQRGNELKRTYNITLEEYDKMLEVQKGVCFICGGVNYDGMRLAVDHNHKTGKIRGLLCRHCNFKLGWYEKHQVAVGGYLG